ncbi:hypothetical protein ACH5RR_036513 [Cinchona calisaya]|uniref:S-adenosylmethionine-dependent methyltransferase n=1 Tax=Cinchona calisaya TaxID=153742 RepID=A0ABD2Y3F6_9GENT
MTTGESFPMNGGDGAFSYAKNSNYQREASNTLKEMIEEAIAEGLDTMSLISSSNTFRVVDLGCSVGPNTYITMQNVIEAVEKKYNSQGHDGSNKLQFQVFFNDHVSNDFNTLFASLPPERQYFAAGVPGSFYDQLFPSTSIHFTHSSYALQWLSKLPDELLDRNSPAWNKGRIHYTGASNEVVNAYASQFEKNMESFLKARATEIVSGGVVVIIMPGIPAGVRYSELPIGILFNFIGSCLLDMANEGIIDEAEIDAFNLPIYAASVKEMTKLIEKNGCFTIEKLEVADPRSKIPNLVSAQGLIMHLRAGMEGLFTKQFGSQNMEEMFNRTTQKIPEIKRWLESGYRKETQLIVVLKRK